jgi:predicted RNA binding protein YcfA (HicA-like mRNA interferase family)
MVSRDKLLEKMLSKPPEVTFAEFERFMEMNGWKKNRERGSHAIFVSPEGRMLTVPRRHGRTVSRTYIIQALKVLELE